MSESLFRKEALEAVGKRSEGEAFIAYPLTMSRISIAMVAALLGFALFACLIPVQDRRYVSGYTEPQTGVVHIHAERSGVVVSQLRRVGDHVLKGADVVNIQAQPQSRSDGGVTRKAAAAVADKLQSLRASSDEAVVERRARMRRLQILLEQNRSELASITEKMEVAMRLMQVKGDQFERASKLSRTDYVSRDFVAGREAELLGAKMQWSELSQQQRRLGLEVKENDIRLQQEAAAQLEEQRALDRAILDEVGTAADRADVIAFSIKAPVSGRISAVAYQPGQFVESSRALLSIMPDDGRMWCVLQVPARELAFLQPGQQVSLRYAAFPYQFFGSFPGVIRRLDSSPISETAVGAEPRYRVFVEPFHQGVETVSGRKQIVPGMQVEAVVWLDERSLASWIVRPITQAIALKASRDE